MILYVIFLGVNTRRPCGRIVADRAGSTHGRWIRRQLFYRCFWARKNVMSSWGNENLADADQSLLPIDELEQYLRILTSQVGPIPPQLESTMNIAVEVFTLTEGFEIPPTALSILWRHSVRTAYIAAQITLSQKPGRFLVWQAFVGGLLHDIGCLIFLTQQPQVFMAVLDLAQNQNQKLEMVEHNLLGITHAECGNTFLARWGVPDEILNIVKFHDRPILFPHNMDFGPLTAVYIANILEGGGFPQDSDGVVDWEGETYLRQLGLWDSLPFWQRWMRDLDHLHLTR